MEGAFETTPLVKARAIDKPALDKGMGRLDNVSISNKIKGNQILKKQLDFATNCTILQVSTTSISKIFK